MVTYLSIRTAPVVRSISTPQKSKMKPWQSEALISSVSVGGVSYQPANVEGVFY